MKKENYWKLLVVGISAVIGRRLIVTKSLIDLDLPLLSISTVLLLGVVWDRQITVGESILLVVTYGIYLLYTVTHKEENDGDFDANAKLPSRLERSLPTIWTVVLRPCIPSEHSSRPA